jgi:hypothetical protein
MLGYRGGLELRSLADRGGIVVRLLCDLDATAVGQRAKLSSSGPRIPACGAAVLVPAARGTGARSKWAGLAAVVGGFLPAGTGLPLEPVRLAARQVLLTLERVRLAARQARLTLEPVRLAARQARLTLEPARLAARQARLTLEPVSLAARQARLTLEPVRLAARQTLLTLDTGSVRVHLPRRGTRYGGGHVATGIRCCHALMPS